MITLNLPISVIPACAGMTEIGASCALNVIEFSDCFKDYLMLLMVKIRE